MLPISPDRQRALARRTDSRIQPQPQPQQPQQPQQPHQHVQVTFSNRNSNNNKRNRSDINHNHNHNYHSNKRVRFNKNMRVRECLHIGEYSFQEAQATWYQRKAFRQTRREIEETIAAVSVSSSSSSSNKYYSNKQQQQQQQQFMESDHFTFRGLEHHTVSGALKRKNVRTKSQDVVLDEQELQAIGKVIAWIPERMASAYCRVSQPSANEARSRGVSDALAVRGGGGGPAAAASS